MQNAIKKEPNVNTEELEFRVAMFKIWKLFFYDLLSFLTSLTIYTDLINSGSDMDRLAVAEWILYLPRHGGPIASPRCPLYKSSSVNFLLPVSLVVLYMNTVSHAYCSPLILTSLCSPEEDPILRPSWYVFSEADIS